MRYITADRIFDGQQFLEQGTVLAYDNQNLLSAIISESEIEKSQIEKHEGVLLPGFINAHCHLELSHLRNRVPQKTGLPAFGPQIVQKRGVFSDEEISEAIKQADEEMFMNGVVAVGDICNTDITFHHKKGSRIHYHSFIELIGFNPVHAEKIFQAGVKILDELSAQGLTGSLAAHAPYSCSLPLIKMISDLDRSANQPFSIHNQESVEETKFFLEQQSEFYGLYKTLGLDISWWKPPGINSLDYYKEEIRDLRTILVHNTASDAKDISSVAASRLFWCFCPSANLYIENKLPDFKLFKGRASNICIGTDSLASNTVLHPLKELNYLYKKAIFAIEELLAMITVNGAKALSAHDRLGMLRTGAAAGLNLIEITPDELKFKKRII